jgi:molybdenum cofactor cytidylyltransferase
MGILVLAAGSSHRFGSDKRTAALPSGDEILHQTLSNATASDFPVTLVLGPRDIELADNLAKQFPRTEIVRSPESPLGIGYSLAFGVDHIRDLGWRLCLIAHGDMPWVTSPLFNAIGKRVSPDNIVVPRYQERVGRPIGYGKNYFGELSDLRGDTDDGSVWHHHTDRVEYLELDNRGILDDIDEPEDLLKHL